jgi:hypothetical protein
MVKEAAGLSTAASPSVEMTKFCGEGRGGWSGFARYPCPRIRTWGTRICGGPRMSGFVAAHPSHKAAMNGAPGFVVERKNTGGLRSAPGWQ